MASEGPRKYRERRSRSDKPYDRPRGIIRRVTDSVTGLFSSSWLSGWLGAEDEEEGSEQQGRMAPPKTSTVPPPGESFIFSQPVTARRSFRPIYPEEGETESNSQQSLGVNEGASTSSGMRMTLPTATSSGLSASTSRSLGSETPSPSIPVRKLPIISSTPAPMFTARTKSHLEPRPLQLLTSSTPTGDDGSEMSESSIDTGVDASVIPRPDERDYQQEILQLDEESLQTLRDTLTKSAPAPPAVQPATVLPSLDETRKRPRDVEPDHTSIRAEGSTSSRSLFSEAGEPAIGTPQPSGLANKRPRFNVSTYGSPVVGDRSVLSNSTFKSSPFYPGKTMYGGASAYRRNRLQSRTSHQTARVQVKNKSAESSDDGGLSQAARRILDSLEQMSTPISDAKRIPTPTPGQRGSFLDAAPSYTASFYKHRPNLRSAPPTSKLLTPTKLPVQENLSKSFLKPSASPSISTSTAFTSSSSSTLKRTVEEPRHMEMIIQEEEKEKKNSSSSSSIATVKTKEVSESTTLTSFPAPTPAASSTFSKAAAEAVSKFKSVPTTTTPLPALSSPGVFKFGLASSNSASKQTQDLVTKATPVMSDSPQTLKDGGGKMKSKVVESGRISSKQEEDVVSEESKLPTVPLTLSSLPKINLPLTVPAAGTPASSSGMASGFRFSIPEVVDTQAAASETMTNALTFTFSSPALVNEESKATNQSSSSSCSNLSSTMMFNSSSPSFAPKLKATAKKEAMPKAPKLQAGSILDILKPKGGTPEKLVAGIASPSLQNRIEEKFNAFGSPKVSSESIKPVVEQTVNNVVEKTSVSQGFEGFGGAFKKSSEEWECSVCMIRNKNSAEKCVACETAKPGKTSSHGIQTNASVFSNTDPTPTITGNGTDWGSAFKKSSNEWDCDMCMLRNKDSVDKCVACETPRPGSKAKQAPLAESKPLDGKEEKVNFGFGSAFAKAKGEWECDTCLVRNKSEATKCISCETPKPGAANISQAITGNFKFGVNTNDSSSTSSSFKFGLDNSQTEVKSNSGFAFGVSAKSAEDTNSKESSGFKFGIASEKPSLGMDSNSESDKSKEKSASASSGISFGLKPDESKGKQFPVPSMNFTFSAPNKPASSTETVNTKPSFTFSSGSETVASFNFGATETKAKQAAGEGQAKTSTEIKPASEIKSGSVLDVLKVKDTKASEVFNFGAKLEKVDGGVPKPSFAFNNAVSTSTKAGDSKSTSDPAVPSGTFTFGANGKESSAGSTTVIATTAPLFTFGDKGSGTSTAPSFAFNTAPAKEESKTTPAFFSGKRENSDSSEPAKKSVFGGSATSINNGVGATPSLFNFGSKENKLASGPGFSTPSATPAFGAPTPASNATPNFQFGNSNPPAPAATAPPAFGNPAPAFGSPAPAFGSNNNNSTPSFTFGQPPEKKQSTGFDFGQTPSNAPTQGFNFAASTGTPGVFQFGQSQANSTPSSGLFQFGSGNTPVQPAPSFGGGGDNPFSAPAPPSGRVMKKAVRRTRKP
nr:nuclear pore complex protein Nup153-like [Penaeus vannamei]